MNYGPFLRLGTDADNTRHAVPPGTSKCALEDSDLRKPKARSTDMSLPGDHAAKTRILFVDKQPLLRHGVATYLNGQPDLMVCGEADSIHSTQSKIAEWRPHLLLIGLRL